MVDDGLFHFDTNILFLDAWTRLVFVSHSKDAWGILQSKDEAGNPGSFKFYPDWDKTVHFTYRINR